MVQLSAIDTEADKALVAGDMGGTVRCSSNDSIAGNTNLVVIFLSFQDGGLVNFFEVLSTVLRPVPSSIADFALGKLAFRAHERRALHKKHVNSVAALLAVVELMVPLVGL